MDIEEMKRVGVDGLPEGRKEAVKCYPDWGQVVLDSLISMTVGWIVQCFAFMVGGTIIRQDMEMMEAGLYWWMPSGVVILAAWVVVFLPVYAMVYRLDKVFRYRFVFLAVGVVVGFMFPFGVIWLFTIGGDSPEKWAVWFALLGASCGGTAAECGFRLRRRAIHKIEQERRTA